MEIIENRTGNFISKEYIKRLKQSSKEAIAILVKENYNNSRNLICILKNLGHISTTFNYQWIVDLLDYPNDDVRFWAVKNIGKLTSDAFLKRLYQIARHDENTMVRREAVSSIGRMRNKKSIPFMTDMLSDSDPKIVCQAIRSLLVFKGDTIIDTTLKELVNHENEMVRTVIYKEYFSKNKTTNSLLPHAETYPYLKNVVVNGDVRDVLKLVPDESIHLTFTSPPYYNARDYSIYPSYDTYLKFLEEVFRETYRVTKEGRFLIVNTSPVIIP